MASIGNQISFGEGGALNRPPLFNGMSYGLWKWRMEVFIQYYDVRLWKVIALAYA